jgi:hypothetical protein
MVGVNIAAVIQYRDIFGRDVDEETLRHDAAALSLHDCLQSLGKLSHLLAAKEEATANNLIFQGLRYPGAVMLAQAMVGYGGRPLVHGRRLMAAARVAILEAADRDPDGFDEQRSLYRFVRLVLGVADVYDPSDAPEGASEQEKIDWLSSLVLKRVRAGAESPRGASGARTRRRDTVRRDASRGFQNDVDVRSRRARCHGDRRGVPRFNRSTEPVSRRLWPDLASPGRPPGVSCFSER